MKTKIGKKGNLFDGMFILVVIFVAAIASIILYITISEIDLNMTDLLSTSTGRTAISNTKTAIAIFDYIYVILVVMLLVSSLVSAYFIKSHPIFFPISIILLFIFLIPATALSNSWEKFTENEKVANVVGDFEITDFFSKRYPWIVGISMLLIMIVLFMYKGPGGGVGHYE